MPDSRAAWDLLREAERVCSSDEIAAAVRRVAGEITARLGDSCPLILTVMNGALVFSGQLLPLLRFPLEFEYVHATRYGRATSGGPLAWRVPPPEAVRGRTVLVLDDILDSGETLSVIRDSVLALGAADFHCAVLLDKAPARAKPARADFIGLEIADRFVFGYGMDAKGLWRNLPEIYAMKE
ncbi:MAG: hypoxanthine-guanine phosphoribosyltransferase [Betaproteobacteria bacterium]|nr:hypoxanthine-guanine phosphoribosyltransferase [Betaproteobacteria bacterium]